jgi:hypothetical protein
MKPTKGQEQEDIDFLLERAMHAGKCSFSKDRDFGASSNSIVEIAYGRIPLTEQVMPMDKSDLNACWNMWKKLPAHRKTEDAQEAILRAEQAVLKWETRK